MKYLIYILFFLFGCVSLAYSQKQKEYQADKYYELYSFDKAINAYNKEDSLNITHLRNLAMSYYNRGEFVEAENAFERCINNDSCQKNDFYYYVLTLKSNEKYPQANDILNEFKIRYPKDLRACSYVHNESEFDSLLVPNSNCEIKNLNLNTDADDFGTAFYNEQIVFTSSRTDNKPVWRNYNWNRRPFLNMFVATRLKSGELFDPVLWNKDWNKKWHEGPASFAEKCTMVAFTRNNYSKRSEDDVVRLQIFFSKMRYGSWDDIEPFELNSADYSVGHPCLSEDGKRMYFTSDMPGGYGGSDIYYVEKVSSTQWGKPVNLGAKVNTEANEMFPFYDEKNKVLYYSSNGLCGLGGLDVYASKFGYGGGFNYPKNLGAPINSSADDFAFICDGSSMGGYFSSNRKSGKGGDDIYSFQYKLAPKPEEKPREHYYKLLVRNKVNGEPILDAKVKVDGKTLRTNKNGEVCFAFTNSSSFITQVDALGYQNVQKNAQISTKESLPVVLDTISLNVEENFKAIVLREVYYDFNKWDILPESKKELNRVVDFLKANPYKKIELSSHTDSRGSDKYNLWLSQKRAESATNYIISQGVDSLRITPKGYGEMRLINGCSNGVPCPEQEHRANRRTEMYIQGYGKASRIEQTKGKY